MLLIKQRSDDGIQSDRFTLTGGTGHQHMRHLAQINHENLIGNRLTQSYRQIISRLLELLATDDTLSGNNLRIGVRYFNTDCSFSRNRRNDTNTQCRKAESDIIFQTTNLGNTNPLLGGNFIQRHRRSHRRLYRTDFNTETAQCIYNLIFIGILLRHVDSRLGIIIMLHQVDSRITIVFQIETGIIGFLFRTFIFVIIFSSFYFEYGFRRFFMERRYRVRNRRFNSHRHFFTRYLGRLCFRNATQIQCNFIFRFFYRFGNFNGSLFFFYICHIRNRNRLFLSFCRPGVRKLFRCFSFLFFLFLFALQEAKAEQSAQPDNCTCAEVDKEADSSHQQNHPNARNTYLRYQPIADIISVHTAQIQERVFILLHKGKAEEDRKPNQQQRTTDKPLPEANHPYTHQLQPRHCKEYKDEERGNTEAVINQITCQLSAARTGIILHPIIGRSQFLCITRINDTLIRRSRKEKRRKGQ